MIKDVGLKILFFGELYPDVIHGVSVANRLNIDQILEVAKVDVVQEKTQVDAVGKTSFNKIRSLFFAIRDVWKKSRSQKYDAFYLVISLSLFGMLKTLAAVYTFSLKNKESIVLHLHRGDFVSFYQRRWINRVLIKFCFYRVARLVVLSQRQREEMSSYFSNDSIFVVENSVLDESCLPEFQTKVVFGNNFVFISNYLKEKGIYDLLSAFSSLDSARLTCYGAFNGNETELKSKQNEYININPVINGQTKFSALYDADALILPSWNEGQPTIILEAMLVGTPVLTTNVGLIEELLGEDYPFYFLPNNPNDLANCVMRFQEYERKEELSEKLKQRYFDLYSQSSHKRKIFEVFNLNELCE